MHWAQMENYCCDVKSCVYDLRNRIQRNFWFIDLIRMVLIEETTYLYLDCDLDYFLRALV